MGTEGDTAGVFKRIIGKADTNIGMSFLIYDSIGIGLGKRINEPIEIAPLSRWREFLDQKLLF